MGNAMKKRARFMAAGNIIVCRIVEDVLEFSFGPFDDTESSGEPGNNF